VTIEYDKALMCDVYALQNDSKLVLPEDCQEELFLLQTNLVLQIKILCKSSFSLEVVFTDKDL